MERDALKYDEFVENSLSFSENPDNDRTETSTRVKGMNRKVLVGESNYAEFEVLGDLLTAKGYKVTWLKNGRDVVEHFNDIEPQLMILDALLPGMTGLKVTQAVKNTPQGKDVKVILMSSVYRQFKSQYESRTRFGVDAYTDKPVNAAEIERIIEDLLGPLPPAEIVPEPAASAETPKRIAEPTTPSKPVEEAPAEPRRRSGVEGSLAETPLPKLIYSLHKYRRTGALRVDRDSVSKVVYFQDGIPIFVTSNQSNDSLGRFLVQRNYITVAQYNASLERMVDTSSSQADMLLATSALSPHDMFRGLQEHVFEKVLSIFAWDWGHYRFRPGRFELDRNVSVQIDPMRMIYAGIRRFYPLTRLEEFFNDYKNKRLLSVGEGASAAIGAGLGPTEMKFVKLINGRRTVGQIVARSHLTLTETFQILYLLIVMEAVRFRGDPGMVERTPQSQREHLEKERAKRAEIREEIDRPKRYALDVHRAHDVMLGQNMYERFDLPRHATPDDVKEAYFRSSKRFRDHNLYQGSDAETRQKADELFEWLTEAYETLLVPDRRRTYDRRLAESPITASTDELRAAMDAAAVEVFDEPVPAATAEAQFEELLREEPPAPTAPATEPFEDDLSADLWEIDQEIAAFDAMDDSGAAASAGIAEGEEDSEAVTMDVGNQLKAELAFQEGEDAMRDGDFESAVDAFAEALRIAPNEAEYHACLGWARFRSDPEDAAEIRSARESLEKAVSMNPSLDSAHYYLGMMALRQGDRGRARVAFQQAVHLNPENDPAARALAEIDGG